MDSVDLTKEHPKADSQPTNENQRINVEPSLVAESSKNPISARKDLVKATTKTQTITVAYLILPHMEVVDSSSADKNLRSIKRYLKKFISAQEFFDYMNKLATDDENVFLIITYYTAKDTVLPQVHEMKQLESVYIFWPLETAYGHAKDNWNYSKLRGFFPTKSSLLKTLTNDLKLHINSNSVPMSILNDEKSMRCLVEENATFVWYQLLFDNLLYMKEKNENAQTEMIEECRSNCKDNQTELEKINEFEEWYAPSQAIFWYTRDCFLYRLLNKVFRTQDFDMIFKYRCFIKDLHKQISELHSLASDEHTILTVYRGQTIDADELERLKENQSGLISMNTFLSTTMDKDVALIYAGNGSDRPLLESVLFEINADNRKTKKSRFAAIKEHSYFQDEEEILFSIDTVFRIEAVGKLTEQVWVITLSLVEEEDELLNYYKTEFSSEPSILTLAFRFAHMEQYENATKYANIAQGNNNISFTFMDNNEFPVNEKPDLTIYGEPGDEYLYKADHYAKQNDFTTALEYFEKALEIQRSCLTWNDPKVLITRRDIASMLCNLGKHEKAYYILKYVLQTQSEILPAYHPQLALTHCSLGILFQNVLDFYNALSYYKKALEIGLQSLPPTHPKLELYRERVSEMTAFVQCISFVFGPRPLNTLAENSSTPDNESPIIPDERAETKNKIVDSSNERQNENV
ncbi:unnamed protein product [Didymodactylos carnosus]|uniref:NAD(P)(+)--arginine ADP-ribosyltransferase n=1 Tax=Didymodactylos carnosus TaxID=1234261 RepID=A0A8S2F932_9BILA|nr:unnamed protein product [Didymodactylos carnosus]CAF4183671.1 unnamed protein product [Didymodactylos carnosus]